jgi:hypothetical protein
VRPDKNPAEDPGEGIHRDSCLCSTEFTDKHLAGIQGSGGHGLESNRTGFSHTSDAVLRIVCRATSEVQAASFFTEMAAR